jgi:hypothetical protein
MSRAARVKRHRERRTADGRRRFEFALTEREAKKVREYIERERRVEATIAERWPNRPATPDEIAIDPRLGREWPDETWADYIAFAQAGWEGLEHGVDDPVFERDRSPDPAYSLDLD